MPGDLYALDFDGVLCDSCLESSLSAIKATKLKWPELFKDIDVGIGEWIVEKMPILRPVIEFGYENVVLVRLLLELKMPSLPKSKVTEGLTIQDILESWITLRPAAMKEWGEEPESLIEVFGKVRDAWMQDDMDMWLTCNRFYPGVAEALKFASSKVYIVTTKQSRFADALLRQVAGVVIPQDRIYGLGSGSKVEVLKQLQSKAEHQGMTLHFVEDRLATLKNVMGVPELDKWHLYMVVWGYNTDKEKEEARAIQRIRLIHLSEFSEKLK